MNILPFPSVAELNARFRRLMTLFQRTSKMSVARREQNAKRSARQEHIQALLQEREIRRLEERQRWTRREEQDFYRTLISFGAEQNQDTGDYHWHRFKKLGRLDSKFDQTLTEYYMAFLAMCKRVCRKSLSGTEESLSWIPEALTEEKCNKVLQRIDFMARIRSCLRQPKLKERIQLCKKTPDLPSWWIPGLHDLYLLKGIAKHGINKSEETIVHDPEFGFVDVWREFQNDPTSAMALSAAARPATRAVAKIMTTAPATAPSGKESESSGEKEPKTEKEEKEEKEKEKGKETKKEGNEAEETEKEDESALSKEKKHATVLDTDLTISQILAQASGNFMHWPKERLILFRLQNICYTVEHGEWPSSSGTRGTPGMPPQSGTPSGTASDIDARSNTPDTPRNTPGLFGESEARDSPLTFLANVAGLKDLGNPAGRSGGRSPKMGPMGGSSRRGRRAKASGGSSGVSTSSGGQNPLQDLMEAEKERMRALMHQSFLQQLTENPMAAAMAASGAGMPFPFSVAGIPPGLAAALGVEAVTSEGQILGATPGGGVAVTAGGGGKKQTEEEGVLNLSTKPKKSEKSGDGSRERRQSSDAENLIGFSPELFAAGYSADMRVPVVSLKDGSKLTGSKAPTLKNVAQWLTEHPQYVIDGGASMGFETELEPGEIPRTACKLPTQLKQGSGGASGGSTSKSGESSTTSGGSSSDPGTRITVVNRKKDLRLTGSKAPQLGNLSLWLEKNPDWDIDSTCTKLVKEKGKLPDKFKSRLQAPSSESSGGGGSKSQKTPTPSTSNTAPTPPAGGGMGGSASSSAASAAAANNAAVAALAAAGLDPFGGLFSPASAMDPASLQLQMQLMMGNPLANPLLGMTGGFQMMPGLFPGMSMPGMSSMVSPPTSTPVTTVAQSLSTSATKTTTSTSTSRSSTSLARQERQERQEQKERKEKERQERKQQEKAAAANAAALAAAQMSGDPFAELAAMDPAAAAAMNPFLLASLGSLGAGQTSPGGPPTSASSGIFGMNPWAGAGLMPGLPPSMAALTQLQGLMGMQGLEALMGGAQTGAFGLEGLSPLSGLTPTTATTGLTLPTISSVSTPSAAPLPPSGKRAEKSEQKTEKRSKGGAGTSSSKSSAGGESKTGKGGGGKLNALVNKLAESAAKSESPGGGGGKEEGGGMPQLHKEQKEEKGRNEEKEEDK